MAVVTPLVDAASARGAWPAEYDREAVFAELLGPLIATYFFLGHEIDDAYLDQRVLQIMRMVEPT